MNLLKARLQMVGLILVAGFFSTHLRATDSPTPSQSDPFIKKNVPAPAPKPGPIYNIILTIEIYDLGFDDGTQLIKENSTDEIRHDHLLALIKSGKAHLATVMSGVVAPGEQTSLEQTEALRYAAEFGLVAGKGICATAYKQRNLGYRFVFKVDPIFDPKTGGFVAFFEHERLDGFSSQPADVDKTVTISHPDFGAARMNIKTFLPFGKPQLLGTASFDTKTSTASASPISLVFGKMDLIPITPSPSSTNKNIVWEHQLSVYSVEREKAADILNQKQEKDSAYQAVMALMTSNEAKLEHFSVARTNSDLKCGIEETTDVPFPTLPDGTETETQDSGFRAEITPLLNVTPPSLNLWTNWTQYRGGLVGATIGSGYDSQPVFDTSGTTTRLHFVLGEHELIGTLTPPPETGINLPKTSDRIWLEFIRTVAVNP